MSFHKPSLPSQHQVYCRLHSKYSTSHRRWKAHFLAGDTFVYGHLRLHILHKHLFFYCYIVYVLRRTYRSGLQILSINATERLLTYKNARQQGRAFWLTHSYLLLRQDT
jgi:hypothetical protein